MLRIPHFSKPEDHVVVVGDDIDEREEGKDENKTSRRKYQLSGCRARLLPADR